MKVIRTKNFSNLFGSILRGAIKGAAAEISGVHRPEAGGTKKEEDTVFGIITLDRFIDKSRFLNKNCVFTIDPDSYEVSGKTNKNSIIDWEIDEKFEPMEGCPKTWRRFTLEGLAKHEGLIDATITTTTGKILKGKVLVVLED